MQRVFSSFLLKTQMFLLLSARHLFTCSQLDSLVNQLTFADEREACAEIIGNRLIDPESYPALLGTSSLGLLLFSLYSSRLSGKEVRTIVEKTYRRGSIAIQFRFYFVHHSR